MSDIILYNGALSDEELLALTATEIFTSEFDDEFV